MKKSIVVHKKIKFQKLLVIIRWAAKAVKDLNISTMKFDKAISELSITFPPMLNKREQSIVDKYTAQYPFSSLTVTKTYLLCNKKAVVLRAALQLARATGREPVNVVTMGLLK